MGKNCRRLRKNGLLAILVKHRAQPDAEIIKIASEQLGLEPTTRSPLDINEEDPTKGIEPAKKKLEENNLPVTDENIFITSSCGDKGINYLLGKAPTGVRKNVEAAPAAEKKASANGYTVSVGSNQYAVKIDGNTAMVNGKAYSIDVKEGIDCCFS